MKRNPSVKGLVVETIRAHLWLSGLLILIIAGSIGASLLPPLVLERIVTTLTEGRQVTASAALGYFGIVAVSGLFDAAKESLITAFGQKVTHGIRSAMYAKLTRLPASFFVEREAGVTTSRFVNDVNAVDNLFTSGIIGMAADLCRLLSIWVILLSRSLGVALLLLAITPLVFGVTRRFQKRMREAQMENRVAVGRSSQQIPETLQNMRTIRTLHREDYMQDRYGDTIEQSFRAQERSNFYDAIYSPIIVSISSLLIGIVMAASARSGTVSAFFGMSAGTAAAVIAFVGNFFGPLESIGMEIQNVQSAVAGVQRIDEFLSEPERKEMMQERPGQEGLPEKMRSGEAAVRISGMTFRYGSSDHTLFLKFELTVEQGETLILTGRTGVGKSTLLKLIAGLYQPQQGEIRVFGTTPDSIPEEEKRRWFGYVEQQFRPVNGTVGDQISLGDPQVTEAQIRQALVLVGLNETVDRLTDGIHTPYGEGLLSQGQQQLLSIARAVVTDPAILLLDEITANLDSQTEELVLTALRAAAKDRTVISVTHRILSDRMTSPLTKFLPLGTLKR